MKSSTSVEEQVPLLQERGMRIDDLHVAQRWLDAVGYYRLSGYSYVYRSSAGDAFRPGTSFDDVIGLYEADRKLRTLVHDGMERFEVGLRAAVSRIIADRWGPSGHEEAENFRPTFDHGAWSAVVRRRVDRARRHTPFVQHHDEHDAGRMPIWAVVEVLDFSDVSRLVEGMRAAEQWEVAEHLGWRLQLSSLSRNQQAKAKRNHPVARWCEQLVIVRNTAAHHGRLWNRSFVPAPTAAMATTRGLGLLPADQSERLGGALLVLASSLGTPSPGSSWPGRVCDLVRNEFAPVRVSPADELGLPAGWDEPGSALFRG